jgi:hypothetical protein
VIRHPHAKAIKRQQTRLKRLVAAFDINWSIEQRNAGDHHQIGRIVHMQPGAVDGAERMGSLSHRMPSVSDQNHCGGFIVHDSR